MSERYNDIIKLSKKYENTTRRVSMRILVIEDERALCETIVRSLKRLAPVYNPILPDFDTIYNEGGSPSKIQLYEFLPHHAQQNA